MTALTMPARPAVATPHSTGRVTFAGVLRSEWIKTWSLRSTRWSLAVAVVLMAGTAALLAVSSEPGTVESAADLIGPGAYFAQLTLATLGVLVITGEYSTGSVRSSFAAVPRRTPVLLAKAAVLAVVSLVAGGVGTVASTLAGLPFHDRLGIALDLGDAEAVRMLAGLPLYLTGTALLGFAIGALLRSSAAALSLVLGLLLVLEQIVGAVPMIKNAAPLLPANAGSRLVMSDARVQEMNDAMAGPDLTPWLGYGVMLVWVVALLSLGVVLVRRRDA